MMVTRFEALKAVDDIFNYCEEIDNSLPENERSGYKMLPDIHKIRKYIIENDRPHGEWGKKTFGYLSTHECSNCGFDGNQLWHFCPSCGADMRDKNELNRVSKELNSEIEKSKSEIVPDYRDGWRLREGERNDI